MKYTRTILIVVFFLLFALTAKNSFAQDADYIIRVTYDGPITLARVEVSLYDIDRSCDTLLEDPIEPPSGDSAWISLVIVPDAEGNIPDRAILPPSDLQLHYAVARATASDGAGGSTDYYVTFGCNDQIPATDPATATLIEIDMHNLWPDVEGTYRIDTLTGVPKSFLRDQRSIRDAMDEFIHSPGLGLLRLIATSVSGELYWHSYPWNELFQCKGNLREPYSEYCKKTMPNKLGKMAGLLVEDNINENLTQFLGVEDAILHELLAPGGEILDSANSLEMTGDLVITQDPDINGYLGNTNYIVFNQVTFQWGGNERTLNLRSEAFFRGDDIEAAVVFHPDPSYHDVYSIAISPFNLSLNYGELLFWVLEGVVFPELINEEIGSIEDMFNFMDCENLSGRLLCEGTYANDPNCNPVLGFAAGAIEEGCTILKTTGLETISSYVSGVLLGEDSDYWIGTPIDDPCQMSFAPGSNEFKIHALGGSNPADNCTWVGEMSSFGETTPVDSTWWGEQL